MMKLGLGTGVVIGQGHIELVKRSFGCDDQTAQVIAARGEQRGYPARETIVLSGAPARDAWLMLTGHAHARAYGASGQLVLVFDFAPGDLFGQATGLWTHDATTEVGAVDDVQVGQFKSAEFLSLMDSYACVAVAVSQNLTRRLADTTRRMIEATTLSAVGRIHAEILRRARAAGDMTIRPSPVLSELALHVQTTRETVSRVISQLEKKGVIRRSSAALIVVAPHRLEEMVS